MHRIQKEIEKVRAETEFVSQTAAMVLDFCRKSPWHSNQVSGLEETLDSLDRAMGFFVTARVILREQLKEYEDRLREKFVKEKLELTFLLMERDGDIKALERNLAEAEEKLKELETRLNEGEIVAKEH